jgi:hypothetical protein
MHRCLIFTAALFSLTVARAGDDNPPVTFADGDGGVIVSITTSIAGSDLRFVAEYSKPIKSYLKDPYDNVALDFDIDTDNNPATGDKQMTDSRRGTDVMVTAVVRGPRKDAKAEEVIVARDSKIMKTDARLKVSTNTITVSVPLSELKIQKGQRIRLVIEVEGHMREQSLKL